MASAPLPDSADTLVRPDPPPWRERWVAACVPTPLTSLIGREREIAAVAAMLVGKSGRLVTLVGPGGVGKTRLALRVAAEMADSFPDGVTFVSLAPITDPRAVGSTVAQAVGMRGAGDAPLTDRLAAFLGDRHLLLVLDNFEQVSEAAPLVVDLLGACPNLAMLVTSRGPLRVSGERQFLVPPLALNPREETAGSTESAEIEAVRLFVERARAVDSDFVVTPESAKVVGEICRRLDGLPLAIELAAARVKVLPPPAMLARLERRLPLLTGGPRNVPARQQTLQAAIAWGYDLLSPTEQALFRWLAVFVGGCPLEGAEALAAGIQPRLGVPERIDSLMDRSLLRQETLDGEPRFGMLETVREFALERLEEAGEEDAARRTHAGYYLALAEMAEPELTGPAQIAWLNRLEAEQHNLRAAFGWTLKRNEVEFGLRLAGALMRFWEHHSHFSEERRWLDHALARWEQVSAPVQAKALHTAGVLAMGQSHYVQATEYLSESLALFRSLGDRYGVAFALNRLGTIDLYTGDVERAEGRFEEGLALMREVGDQDGIAALLGQLGYAALLRGQHDRAVTSFEESLQRYRDLGSRLGSGKMLDNLGRAVLEQGDDARALCLLEEGLDLNREAGNRWYVAECLEALAVAESRLGAARRGARLWGAAEALRDTIGAPVPPGERAHNERWLAEIRSRLDDSSFATARSEGRAMPWEQAVARAAADDRLPPPRSPIISGNGGTNCSPRASTRFCACSRQGTPTERFPRTCSSACRR